MKWRSLLKIVSYITICLILLAVLLLLYFMFYPSYMVITVKSDSMMPTFSKGDVIVLRSRRAQDIKPGQIIAFTKEDSKEGEITMARRVISIENDVISTKGDAMESKDSWRVLDSQVQGVYFFRIPLLGHAAKFLHGNSGDLFLIGSGFLLLAAIAVAELLNLRRSRKGGDIEKQTESIEQA